MPAIRRQESDRSMDQSRSHHVIVIAEAGVNHNGSLDLALKMVKEAANAGADYVKFQTFKAEKLVASSAPKAEYQKANCNDGDGTQLSMLKKLELSEKDFISIAEECKKEGIGFMSTPFDEDSIEFLSMLGMDYWKIPSGEITNLPYLRHIASKGGKIILSTGMSTLSEVMDAVGVLEKNGTPKSAITLLHCTTQYPTPPSEVNLRAMDTLRSLGCSGVGYSDHTEGIVIPIAATALGARLIEKHFTLDRNMPGPDHKASLNPLQLAEMVRAIRVAEQSLGSGIKDVAEVERPNIGVARKSIVASRPIKRGELFSESNLTVKRPGTGISPMLWDTVIGTTSPHDFNTDELIEL